MFPSYPLTAEVVGPCLCRSTVARSTRQRPPHEPRAMRCRRQPGGRGILHPHVVLRRGLMAQRLRQAWGSHFWYYECDKEGTLREGRQGPEIEMKSKQLSYEEDRPKVAFLERQSKLLGYISSSDACIPGHGNTHYDPASSRLIRIKARSGAHRFRERGTCMRIQDIQPSRHAVLDMGYLEGCGGFDPDNSSNDAR
ncbi:hypothetical protein OH77DRAFT_1181059 [Trametes cingulata]|nr:hypothetical protein OH77DRAFT_1181059 [Trametes cingulata]